MALLTALPTDAALALGAEFGLAVRACEALAVGSVNSNFALVTADGTRFFARLYEEQPTVGAERELALLELLATSGVPVVRPLRATSGQLVREYQGKAFAVFPWLEGDWLCLKRVTREHCREVGAALARVHNVSAQAQGLSEGRFRPEDMLERLKRVEAEGPPRLKAAVDYARDRYAHYLLRRNLSLPRGICHGDLFRDNVLWQGSKLAALIDFESVALGSFAYDLMVTLLAWCYADSLVVPHARAMYEGYSAVRPLTDAERAGIEVEGALACLRFVTSRLTDFELRAKPGEPPGRDFQRFFARLEAIEGGAFSAVFG